MLLTILIPTRSRVGEVLQTVQAFARQVEESNLVGQVEVVVVDNFSTDSTAEKVQALCRHHVCVRYEHHLAAHGSAETSLFHAIQFAVGRWIWSFGDDDKPTPGSVQWLVSYLNRELPSFVLINCSIRTPDSDVSIPYFDQEETTQCFPNAIELFRKYGLISATTTISCLVFERKHFSLAKAVELAEVSQIYSHSAAMLVSFCELPAAFVSRVLCEYRQNSIDEETERLSMYCRTRGMLLEELFTNSVGALANAIGRLARIEISEIARFEEPEFSKTDRQVSRGPLWAFVMRFADARLAAIRERRSGLVIRSDIRIIFGVIKFMWNARLRLPALRYVGRASGTIITAVRRRVKRSFIKGPEAS